MTKHPPITVMIPCLIDAIYTEAGNALVRLFDRLQIPFVIPDTHTCCGLPAFNSGYRRQAAVAAKHFITVFEGSSAIVCPSGSCVHMVRHHYPELFKSDPEWFERAVRLSKNIFEMTEYLTDVLGIEDTGSDFQGRVTFHDSCQTLRYLGIFEQPRKLIRSIKGTELIEMKDSDRCCGFGGSFSVHYPDISASILEDKIANILKSGADIVTGCDSSCLMHIQGMLDRKQLPIRTMHIVQVLAGGGI